MGTGSRRAAGRTCCATATGGGGGRRGGWRGRGGGGVLPDPRHARCWVHKVANVLSALPKSAHPSARRALAEIRDAEDREHAQAAIKSFANDFGVKGPTA